MTKQESLEASDAVDLADSKVEANIATLAAEPDQEVDEQTSKRIGRMLDKHLMPLICFTYILQSLDKGSLGYGAIWGLRTDLRLTADEYSWLGSLFYFGYMIWEYPMGYVAQHYHTGKVVASVVIIWGACLMSTALCTNFAGIAAQRFFLGCLESVLTPAFVLITSIFWLKKEQGFRVSIWWSMNGFAGAFGGLISFSTGYIQYKNIPSWKWIFIINGTVTILWGITLWFLFPSSPQTARFLKGSDKDAAVYRLKSNKTGTRNAIVKKYQIIEALDPRKDPQGILLFFICFFNEFTNGGYGNFSSLIIASLGFTSLESSLLGIATGMAQVLWMWSAGYATYRWKNMRIYAAMGALVPSFIGFVLQIAVPVGSSSTIKGIKMMGVCMMPAYAATCALTVQLPAQNAGGYTKRTTLTSLAFLGYSVGNICGPHVFYPGQTPTYLTGFVADLVCFAFQWSLLYTLRVVYKRENARRDREFGIPVEEDGDAFTDLTDRENMSFRYAL
ncbi:putative MFS transporter [Dioszegia hungarica]|uniref:MFS transporter n=1 Tax=Dioszegia hungarica TaxID=4972 RepID=A0AA38H3G4_9TREE|nr:putative MFS transporter [Dioszegia hungarica]KAI9633473.1 putative MFS transporter [Dioszegia hungarica]